MKTLRIARAWSLPVVSCAALAAAVAGCDDGSTYVIDTGAADDQHAQEHDHAAHDSGQHDDAESGGEHAMHEGEADAHEDGSAAHDASGDEHSMHDGMHDGMHDTTDGGHSGAMHGSGCAMDATSCPDTLSPGDRAQSMGGTQVLQVELLELSPPGMGLGMNSLDLRVLDMAGRVVQPEQLFVAGWMPDHGHGTAEPVVTFDAEANLFRVTDLDLTMPGLWRVYFFACDDAESVCCDPEVVSCADGSVMPTTSLFIETWIPALD